MRVKECFDLNRWRYGSRRIAASLKTGSVAVQKVMRRENLQAIQPKQFKLQTTDPPTARRRARIFCRLEQMLRRAEARGWFAILLICICNAAAFVIWCCLQDKFTRRIIKWKITERMTAQLVINVFLSARRGVLIDQGAIIHTDKRSQYAALEYRGLLYIGGFRQSISKKGNCYDRAQAESFFSKFKAELLEGSIFESV